ncbi:MAG: hypothetical protein K9W43_09600 [Candidatus Thorarchaeota archaeon]|nr:hypothetical protein [Candidatus Thorarchaeota archaeon]
MVSRSLEKMMLIAVGLTTVVLVGVPVLLYSINTLQAVSQYEQAQMFAHQLHNATAKVDGLQTESMSLELILPEGVEVSAAGQVLTVSYTAQDSTTKTWTISYNHTIDLTPPDLCATYIVTISLKSDVLEIIFTAV